MRNKCADCGIDFIDTHGHGFCFGCKIKGLSFGKVPQGPSRFWQEKETVADAKAAGIQLERADDNMTDKRDKPLPPLKRPKAVQELIHRYG